MQEINHYNIGCSKIIVWVFGTESDQKITANCTLVFCWQFAEPIEEGWEAAVDWEKRPKPYLLKHQVSWTPKINTHLRPHSAITAEPITRYPDGRYAINIRRMESVSVCPYSDQWNFRLVLLKNFRICYTQFRNDHNHIRYPQFFHHPSVCPDIGFSTLDMQCADNI